MEELKITPLVLDLLGMKSRYCIYNEPALALDSFLNKDRELDIPKFHVEEKNELLNRKYALLKYLLPKHEVMICGGSIVELILIPESKERPRDIDLFFKSPQHFEAFKEELITRAVIDGFIVDDTLKNKFSYKFNTLNILAVTDNATTLKFEIGEHKSIQLIKARYGNSVEEVIDSFDLNICKAGLDCATGRFVIKPECLKDFFSRRIHLSNTRDTWSFSSAGRIYKYAMRYRLDPRPALVDLAKKVEGDGTKTFADVKKEVTEMCYQLDTIFTDECWTKEQLAELFQSIFTAEKLVSILKKEGKFINYHRHVEINIE